MLYYERSLSVTDDSAIGLTCSFESLSEQTSPLLQGFVTQAVFDKSIDNLSVPSLLSDFQELVWVANDFQIRFTSEYLPLARITGKLRSLASCDKTYAKHTHHRGL